MNDRVENIRKQFGSQLSELICRKVNHEDHCHDILQEVYLKIIKNIDKIEKVENVAPYVKKIADNMVIDYFRSKIHTNPTEELPDEIMSHEKEITEKTTLLASSFLMEMIGALPTIYKEALIKTELKGISQKQLATELGISYSGLKSRVQRAKEMLRQSILDCCDYKFDRYGNVVSCCGNDCC